MSAPFELSVSLSEAEYEKYGPVLQKVLVNLLSDSPSHTYTHIHSCNKVMAYKLIFSIKIVLYVTL